MKFKPIEASDEDLEKYGFPPRPQSQENKEIWNDIMSQSLDHVILGGPGSGVPNDAVLKSNTWSGAIQMFNDNAGEFFLITSTWIIPDACPPPKGNYEGRYACYSFVGFDGWKNSGPPALIWGTKSVYDQGQHYAKVFLQYCGKEYIFDTPQVIMGDLVSAFLWVSDRARPKKFGFFLVNRNTGRYTLGWRHLPQDFQGASAEWILGRQDLDYGNPGHAVEALPVDTAQLIDMVDAKCRGCVISTAKKVGPNLLNVYAYHDE
jgi:hypothetical protein